MASATEKLATLEKVLAEFGPIAVALSGGIDSMTLAAVAHRTLPGACEMFHAVSPAVPGEASERVRAYARKFNWTLNVFDAGEFDDAAYMQNPLNRCFYCKTHLYGAVRARTELQIVSGTNTDDLGEYRPGLIAAREHAVRHPFVEAAIDKATVRQIAQQVGLAELSDLPASPCLSSRVETGIAIDSQLLRLIHLTERQVDRALTPKTVRCRIRAEGVVVELDDVTLAVLDTVRRARMEAEIAELFRDSGFTRPVRFAPYRVGSAFLHPIKLHARV